MVRIKEEPIGVELRYRTAEIDSEENENYYDVGSIGDQVQSALCMDELDVKPKIEPIEIDAIRQPVVSLDIDFVRGNFRPKWIELVKATFRHPSMERACQLCDGVIGFASASQLIKHYDEFHRKEILSYACTLCDFSAKKKLEMGHHWAEKHRGRKQNHIEVKKINDRHNVWIGDDELVHSLFVNEQQSSDQKQSQGNEPTSVEGVNNNPRIWSQQSNVLYVECDICLKKMQKGSMKKHKVIHIDKSKRKKFECKNCSKQFLYRQDLRRHQKLHSGDPFKCDICGRVFDHFRALKRHIFCAHLKAKPFKCGICSKAFARSENLKYHEVNVHLKGKMSDDDPRMKYKRKNEVVECDICLKKIMKSHLKKHKMVHTNERPEFKCDLCNHSYKSKGNLYIHKAAHKNEKLLECTFCSLKFRTKSLMITHEKSHRRDSQFKCQFCNIKSTQKRSLYLHYRTVHFDLLRQRDKLNGGLDDFFQDVPTFECYKCKYSTYNLKHAREHIEACKTGPKFIKCPECIVKFDSMAYMRWHMKRIHPKKA